MLYLMMLKKKWFTLIEMMIVIAVFSVGVLAVLRMVLYNMSVMDGIETKTTATFLAKESMDLVYSLRDSNRLAWLPWNCVVNRAYQETDVDLDMVCRDYLFSWNMDSFWQIGFDPEEIISVSKADFTSSFDKKLEDNALYLLSWEQLGSIVYTYDTQWSPTIFARYVVFTGVVENGKILPMDRIVKVESHVLYRRWLTTGDVVLESFIWNY